MVTRFCSSPKKRRVSRAGRHERNRTTLATRSRAAGDAVTTFVYHRACHVRSRLEMRANGGVDRATALRTSLAGSRLMRESLPVAPVQRFVSHRPSGSGRRVNVVPSARPRSHIITMLTSVAREGVPRDERKMFCFCPFSNSGGG
jgi:hypothetical protein